MKDISKTQIPIFLLVFIIAIGIVIYINKVDTSEFDEKYKYIASLNVDKDFEPKEILDIHEKITELIYSGTLDEKKLKYVFDISRELYSDELLEINPYDEQYENILLIVEDIKRPIKVSYKIKEIVPNKNSDRLISINIIQYLNDEENNMVYEFIKENGKWKILSFKEV